MTTFADRVLSMANIARGLPVGEWPGWSMGEMLAVALVLNDHASLTAIGYTMVEAFDRLDGEIDARQLRAIERHIGSVPRA
jgi:hypothetical protein